MEHLVVSLKTAEKLKAAGFSQATALYWNEYYAGPTDGPSYWEVNTAMAQGYIAAPTAQEIANQLTAVEDRVWNVEPVWQGESDKSYVVSEPGGDVTVTPGIHLFYGDSIVDVLAQLWLNKHEVQS